MTGLYCNVHDGVWWNRRCRTEDLVNCIQFSIYNVYRLTVTLLDDLVEVLRRHWLFAHVRPLLSWAFLYKDSQMVYIIFCLHQMIYCLSRYHYLQTCRMGACIRAHFISLKQWQYDNWSHLFFNCIFNQWIKNTHIH